MDYIERISAQYDGNILLHAPYTREKSEIVPEELDSILRISNGISETMHLPDTGETITIGWIIYPYDMMREWTSFFAANYGIQGTVFSDDGTGCPYIRKNDGSIASFNDIDQEEERVADTLLDFFQ